MCLGARGPASTRRVPPRAGDAHRSRRRTSRRARSTPRTRHTARRERPRIPRKSGARRGCRGDRTGSAWRVFSAAISTTAGGHAGRLVGQHDESGRPAPVATRPSAAPTAPQSLRETGAVHSTRRAGASAASAATPISPLPFAPSIAARSTVERRSRRRLHPSRHSGPFNRERDIPLAAELAGCGSIS